MTKEFPLEQGRQHGGSHDSLVLYGDDPQLDSVEASTQIQNGHPRSPFWEVLPPEETKVTSSVLVHPKAKSILTAFIGGATKPEIARVFGLKEKLVRSVIAAAQQQLRKH